MSLSEQAVASHYEQFPYPPVDNMNNNPQEIPTFFGTSLFELNYFLWGGRRKFTETGLNILIAGGGTSQMSAVVAHMLQEHHVPGMVVHLDLSLNSIALAREHAVGLGVEHLVAFVQGSLLNVSTYQPVMQHAPKGFDLIISTGVLHHLKNPSLGLISLRNALATNGGMFLMVYGTYGRAGVYHIQEALRTLAPADGSMTEQQRVKVAKDLVQMLPHDHPLLVQQQHLVEQIRKDRKDPTLEVGDLDLDTDSGIYDHLLHSQETSYTVASLVELAESAGVEIVDFVPSAKYDPLKFLRRKPTSTNDSITDRLTSLKEDWRDNNEQRFELYEIGEKLAGSIIDTHSFYVVKKSSKSLEKVKGEVEVEERGYHHAGNGLDVESLKQASVCRPRGSVIFEQIILQQRSLLQQRIGKEGITGWKQEWSMWANSCERVYYHQLPPLSGEIAAAALGNSSLLQLNSTVVDNVRCRTVMEMFEVVKRRFDDPEAITWELFAAQVKEIVLIGQSVMHVLLEFSVSEEGEGGPKKQVLPARDISCAHSCIQRQETIPKRAKQHLYPINIQNVSLWPDLYEFNIALTSPPQHPDLLDILSGIKDLCYRVNNIGKDVQWSKQCVPQHFDRFVMALRAKEQAYLQMSLDSQQSDSQLDSKTKAGIRLSLQMAHAVSSQRCTPDVSSPHLWTVHQPPLATDHPVSTKYSNIQIGGGSSTLLTNFLNIDISDLKLPYGKVNEEIQRTIHSHKMGTILSFPDIETNEDVTIPVHECQYMKYDLSTPVHPLPAFISNGSVKLLYSEHFIEHLNHNQLVLLLQNIRRVLVKKGQGVARLSTPDLRKFVESYVHPKNRTGWFEQHKTQLKSVKKNVQSAKYDYLGYWGQEQARMPHVLNDLFHDWGHDKGFLYDYEEFFQTALQAGFDATEITRVEFHRPANSSLAHFDQFWRRLDSFYVELRNLEN
jgi:SAM-dependent methyltransferase